MKSHTFYALGLSLTLALCLSASAAMADGMPFKKPEPAMTPLDKALDEIQNKEPPIDVTAKPAEAPPEPQPAPVAAAAPAPTPPPVPEARVVEVQPNSGFFGLSFGMYDPFTHGKQAGSINVEFQPGVKVAGILQPLFGALVTTNGALMGYGGVGIPFKITDRIRLMPSVAVGAYHGGGGVDFDHNIGLRTGAELAYMFDDNSRIGLNFHVLTDGMSFSRHNRTEVIGIAYTVPFELFSGSPKKKAEAEAAPPAGK